MDIKKIVEQDNQKETDLASLVKKQSKVIEAYENDIELGVKFSNKLAINKSYRDEVHQFFIDNGFEKSNTNHEGHTIMSTTTNYYKCQNTWMAISFSEYSETEDTIQVIRPVENEYHSLVYTLDNSIKNMMNFKGFILNNELIHIGNYKEIIKQCNSIEDLIELENLINKNIEDTKAKLNKDIEVVYKYQLRDGQQFATFKEAFSAL